MTTATTIPTVPISEIFGPTWQGEGPNTGRRAFFIRTGRCNLTCTWCDTKYTWDWKQYDPKTELDFMTVNDIQQRLNYLGLHSRDLVVITGGEPLIHTERLTELIPSIFNRNVDIEIETNGTLLPLPLDPGVVRYNVSPKLSNSGVAYHQRINVERLRRFVHTPRVAFKFVAQHPTDLTEVQEIVNLVGVSARHVWIMPEGTDPDTLMERARQLAPFVEDRHWNLTLRLQSFLAPNQRGV